MGTTNEKLNHLQETKEQIKTAIIESGIEITEDTTFRQYVDKIKEIVSRSDDALGRLKIIYEFYLPDILDMPAYEWIFEGLSTDNIRDLSEIIEFCVSACEICVDDIRESLGTLTGTDLSETPIDNLSSVIDGIKLGGLKWESLSWREV